MKVIKYIEYLWYVIRHKWFVGVACLKMGMIWEAITHDISKLLPSEFIPYMNYFYGEGKDIKRGRDATGYYKRTDTGDKRFDSAWLLHQKRNNHHWQWFVLPEDEGGVKILPMPKRAILHMLCDWWGAGKAQHSNLSVLEWYEFNKNKMQLNQETADNIRRILETTKIFKEKRN